MPGMLTHNERVSGKKRGRNALVLRLWTLDLGGPSPVADLRPSTFDLAISTAKDAKVEGPGLRTSFRSGQLPDTS
jgi:hypothetical protein